MNQAPQKVGFVRGVIGLLALLSFAVQPVFADAEDSRIDWIANDGSAAISPSLHIGARAAASTRDDTVSCPLKEGDSTFVIALPKSTLLDRLTFINENGNAQGELRIAVSNYRLPADSPKWNAVEGSVRFAHKRLFNLSMLGVEAKYVRLSFHVENAGRIAALGLRGAEMAEKFPLQESHVLHISNPIPSGNGNDGLAFGLADLYAHSRILYISSGPANVARRMIDENPADRFSFFCDQLSCHRRRGARRRRAFTSGNRSL